MRAGPPSFSDSMLQCQALSTATCVPASRKATEPGESLEPTRIHPSPLTRKRENFHF